MSITGLLLLSVVIAGNNLAVSFAMGTFTTKKEHLKIVIVFGVFEFVVPLLGILIGQQLAKYIDQYASVVGSVVLILLGCYTVVSSLINKDQTSKLENKLTSLKGLILLALGLSLDNLIVGFGLGFKEVSPLIFAGVISLTSVVFSFIGLRLGKYLSEKFRKITEIFAGFLLIILGILTFFDVF